MPDFVVKEFEVYLRCGILEHGLAHFACRHCGESGALVLATSAVFGWRARSISYNRGTVDISLALGSLREYLQFVAMLAYASAVESGDFDRYRDDPALDLDDLFHDYWSDKGYLVYRAYYALRDELRAHTDVLALMRSAPTEFMCLVADHSAMHAIFKLAPAEQRQRRRVFDGAEWVSFGEFEGYSADLKARTIAEFGAGPGYR